VEIREQDRCRWAESSLAALSRKSAWPTSGDASRRLCLGARRVAISKIDEEEAREIFSYIEQIEQLGELEDAEPPLRVRSARRGGGA